MKIFLALKMVGGDRQPDYRWRYCEINLHELRIYFKIKKKSITVEKCSA